MLRREWQNWSRLLKQDIFWFFLNLFTWFCSNFTKKATLIAIKNCLLLKHVWIARLILNVPYFISYISNYLNHTWPLKQFKYFSNGNFREKKTWGHRPELMRDFPMITKFFLCEIENFSIWHFYSNNEGHICPKVGLLHYSLSTVFLTAG